MGYGRPAWAEIDLLAIKKNMEQIKTLIKPGVLFCPILKADAYGHGAPAVARIAEQLGADYVGVAVLAKNLDVIEDMSDGMKKMMELSVNPNLGANIDVSV